MRNAFLQARRAIAPFSTLRCISPAIAGTGIRARRYRHAKSALQEPSSSSDVITEEEYYRLKALRSEYTRTAWKHSDELLEMADKMVKYNQSIHKLYDFQRIPDHMFFMHTLSYILMKGPTAYFRRLGFNVFSTTTRLRQDHLTLKRLHNIKDCRTISESLSTVKLVQYRSGQFHREGMIEDGNIGLLIDEQLDFPLRPIPTHLKTQMMMFVERSKVFARSRNAALRILTKHAMRKLWDDTHDVTAVIATSLINILVYDHSLMLLCRAVNRGIRTQSRFYQDRLRSRKRVILQHLAQLEKIKGALNNFWQRQYLPLLARRLDLCSQPQLEQRELLERRYYHRVWRLEHEFEKREDAIKEEIALIRRDRNDAKGERLWREKQDRNRRVKVSQKQEKPRDLKQANDRKSKEKRHD
ncbi:hypothetical protein K491DRAFT_721076 [Lophiostoma macrostomum CBS 122681]|uniref:Uncharacterized protein n=1 Tax=Lophiostoma macrostomum CBS 122681 TaxID=1314788 RepID=A0A6A6SQJ5_9PLEO|nr:hypothetical protein K491DRAFT_721076 [Lophiostoma macrostomum CBS 122681]